MNTNPRIKKRIVGQCGDDVRVAYPLFHREGGGSIPTSPLQLHIGFIDRRKAIRLNKLWHSRLPRIENIGDLICFAAIYQNVFYAVAIWSHPIAPLLPQDTWLELRRMAIASDAPKNTASRMIAVMAKMIKQKYPCVVRLISYQDTEVHEGTIYKASNWRQGQYERGGSGWNRPSRFRPDYGKSYAPKIRWQYDLRK